MLVYPERRLPQVPISRVQVPRAEERQVNNPPYPYPAQREELQHAQADVPQIKPVDAQQPDHKRQDQGNGVALCLLPPCRVAPPPGLVHPHKALLPVAVDPC